MAIKAGRIVDGRTQEPAPVPEPVVEERRPTVFTRARRVEPDPSKDGSYVTVNGVTRRIGRKSHYLMDILSFDK